MDINVLREIVLLLAVAAFGGVVWWAYSPSRQTRFDRAAMSILHDDDRETLDDAKRPVTQAGKG
jgi:cbb3-type cytochrome oxidase subunit 3